MTSIYVVGHKPFALPEGADSSYRPMMVGPSKPWGRENGYAVDDDGLNISDKNSTFCELTAYYWAWKNPSDDDLLGFCHYRRYFMENDAPLNTSTIEKIFSDPTVVMIVPEKTTWRMDKVTDAYIRGAGYQQDLIHTENVIREKWPEYLDAFHEVLDSNSAYYRNMLIARRDIFEAYCSWLFSILFEVEKRVDLSSYNATERRVFGFLSEILLNVYIVAKKLKVVEVPTSSFDVESKGTKTKQTVMRFGKSMIKRIVWFPTGINPKKRSS